MPPNAFFKLRWEIDCFADSIDWRERSVWSPICLVSFCGVVDAGRFPDAPKEAAESDYNPIVGRDPDKLPPTLIARAVHWLSLLIAECRALSCPILSPPRWKGSCVLVLAVCFY